MHLTLVGGPEGKLACYSGGRTSSLDSSNILFIHSDAGRSQQWAPVWNALGDRYRLVALDLRGHGASQSARNDDYTYAGRARDVLAAVRWAGLTRFVIVSHSAGAGVALQFAAEQPDMVSGIFLVDPASDPAAMSAESRKQVLEGLAGPDGAKVLHDYQASIAGKDAAVLAEVDTANAIVRQPTRAGIGRALDEWNPRAALAAVDIPIAMVITVESDGPGSIYHLQSGISHSVITGTGHWIQLERPSDIAKLVDGFAARISAAR